MHLFREPRYKRKQKTFWNSNDGKIISVKLGFSAAVYVYDSEITATVGYRRNLSLRLIKLNPNNILILTFFFARIIPESSKRVPKKGMLLIKAKRSYVVIKFSS